MSTLLNITLLQNQLHWERPVANRYYFETLFEPLESTDLIVLPEMFTTGFTMNPKPFAETMKGETVLWMKYWAQRKNAAITGSLIIKEHRRFYNRLVFVQPNGTIDTYNKRHTFTLAGEHKAYTAGNSRLIVDYLGWKICPLICYDLRFPVWSRNTDGFDALLYVANWPKPRISAWDTLLCARAIENMCYTVGVNRVGTDANGHDYPGHSAVYGVLGDTLGATNAYREEILRVTLDKSDLLAQRKKLGFLNDRDAFSLEINGIF